MNKSVNSNRSSNFEDSSLMNLFSETEHMRSVLAMAAEIADEWTTPFQRQFGNGGPKPLILAIADGNERLEVALAKAAEIADEWTTPFQRQFGNGGPKPLILALIETA